MIQTSRLPKLTKCRWPVDAIRKGLARSAESATLSKYMKPWFDKSAVKAVVFYTLIATIFFCMFILISAIWGAFGPDEQTRDNWLLTVAVLASGVLLMCLTNWSFLVGEENRGPGEMTHIRETPISRALDKAKVRRDDASES